MQDYRHLQVWQRSHELVLELYRTTQVFPAGERYGFMSQLRRAALSVPTSIAEGARRASAREFANFLNIAHGSLSETEYLVLVSRDLGFIPASLAGEYLSECSELLQMLAALRRKVQGSA